MPAKTPIQYQVPITASVERVVYMAPRTANLHVTDTDGGPLNDEARPLLVFFSSARSGPSRRMESLLAHIARKERHRLRVTQVDVEHRRDLAERLGVVETPTLVLVRDRRPVGRLEGRTSAPRIEAMLNEHLAEAAVP
jgi:thioredoxin 1